MGDQEMINSIQTVVIVDDEFTSRTILKEAVNRIKNTLIIKTFESPIESLNFIENNEVDLIVLDSIMEEMSGYDVLLHLKKNNKTKDIPVIIVTADSDRKLRYKMLEKGAADFITKPIDHHECSVRCKNALQLYHHQKLVEKRAAGLEVTVEKVNKATLCREHDTLLRLAKAGDFRDSVLGNHVIRISKYARLIVESLGMDSQYCDMIEMSAPLHDIGKVGISDAILLKANKLNPEEYAIMKKHTVIGYEILKGSPSQYLVMGANIALSHHEKYDGTGYPHGLKGEEIPLEARIVAVASVFDVLTSIRPYKPAWSNSAAFEHIVKQSGIDFDPRCVEALLDHKEQISVIQKIYQDAIDDNPLDGF